MDMKERQSTQKSIRIAAGNVTKELSKVKKCTHITVIETDVLSRMQQLHK